MDNTEETSTSAADVLADGQDFATIGGEVIRKGTVAAFVANATRYQTLDPDSDEGRAIRDALIGAVPQLRAIGLLDVFAPRSAAIRDLVAGA